MTAQYYAIENGDLQSASWSRKQGYKQRPFQDGVRPVSAYYSQGIEILDSNNWSGIGGRCGTLLWGEVSPNHVVLNSFQDDFVDFSALGNEIYARAYSKFQEKAYTQAATGTALKERTKTFEMVVARLTQLQKGAKHLKRGRFKEFLRTFGIAPLKKDQNRVWSRPKEFGALWLEYWMGWAPTVGDIYAALDALTRILPWHPIRAGSRRQFHSESSLGNGAETTATSLVDGFVTVHISASIEIENPAAHMLQTLGLLNPLKTGWETTPFSWFADWFTNVGQVLGQLTDWVGLKLKNLCISVKTVGQCSYKCEGARWIFDNVPETLEVTRGWRWFTRNTVSSMPLLRPIIRFPTSLSRSRGATLVSLLVTMFTPDKQAEQILNEGRLINGRYYQRHR